MTPEIPNGTCGCSEKQVPRRSFLKLVLGLLASIPISATFLRSQVAKASPPCAYVYCQTVNWSTCEQGCIVRHWVTSCYSVVTDELCSSNAGSERTIFSCN